MADQPDPSNKGGLQQHVGNIVLILRMMGDSRISFWLKLLPVASLVYLLVPDFVPGPFDDAAVIGLLNYLFVELSPKGVVDELRKK